MMSRRTAGSSRSSRPVAASQSDVPSSPVVARSRPSGLNATCGPGVACCTTTSRRSSPELAGSARLAHAAAQATSATRQPSLTSERVANETATRPLKAGGKKVQGSGGMFRQCYRGAAIEPVGNLRRPASAESNAYTELEIRVSQNQYRERSCLATVLPAPCTMTTSSTLKGRAMMRTVRPPLIRVRFRRFALATLVGVGLVAAPVGPRLAGVLRAQDAPKSTTLPAKRANAKAAVDIPRIPYTRYVLKNGLVALLNEDHSSPIVYTTVWYHVGSKNELPGRTGFAHLFEHMMFEGSENIESGQHRVMIQSMGGSFNGSTTEDRTNYYETVPANQLETALWMESDRMATLLTRIDQKRLDAEREIVKNERRLRVDNQPFGVSSEILSAALYPADYPYYWPVIGSMADLSAASLDDVKDFFRTYYAPNNAVIALSGDFKTDEAKQLLNKYFGA